MRGGEGLVGKWGSAVFKERTRKKHPLNQCQPWASSAPLDQSEIAAPLTGVLE